MVTKDASARASARLLRRLLFPFAACIFGSAYVPRPALSFAVAVVVVAVVVDAVAVVFVVVRP